MPWRGTSSTSLGRERKKTGTPGVLVRAMTRGYHGILVGLESVPSDEDAKTFAGLMEMTSLRRRNSTTTNSTLGLTWTFYKVAPKILCLLVFSTQQKMNSYPMAMQNLRGNVCLRNLRDLTMRKK